MLQLEHWISGETTSSQIWGRPAYFNTRLDWRNANASQTAKLTICLRVLLVPLVPVPNSWMKQHVFSVLTGVAYRLLPWNPLDFQKLRNEVKRQADSCWGNIPANECGRLHGKIVRGLTYINKVEMVLGIDRTRGFRTSHERSQLLASLLIGGLACSF